MAPGSPRSTAAEAPRAGSVPLVAAARLPLAFIVAGLLAFGAGAAWLARAAWAGLPPHLHPGVVALAHLWLPGFLLSVCLGASYQLMPVVLGTPLRAPDKALWTHAALHLGGTLALVVGLHGGRYALAGLGGVAINVGACVLFAATLRTFLAAKRRDAAAWSFPLSSAWLLATVLAGVLLAMNRRHPFLPLSALDLLRAHAHLGLVGYFATLLQGVTFQLVPMFTMGAAKKPALATGGLFAVQGGLVLLAFGLGGDQRPPLVLGSLVVALGLAASGAAFVSTLASRRRRRLDPGVRAFVVGLALLGLSTLVGLSLVVFELPAERLLPGASVYGLLGIVGGLGLAVLGMLGKILPFLVWMKAYGPRVGREPVPVATTLSSRPLEHAWFAAHLLGLLALGFGAAFSLAWPAATGGVLLAGGAVCFLLNAFRVLRHLWHRPAPAAARRPCPPQGGTAPSVFSAP